MCKIDSLSLKFAKLGKFPCCKYFWIRNLCGWKIVTWPLPIMIRQQNREYVNNKYKRLFLRVLCSWEFALSKVKRRAALIKQFSHAKKVLPWPHFYLFLVFLLIAFSTTILFLYFQSGLLRLNKAKFHYFLQFWQVKKCRLLTLFLTEMKNHLWLNSSCILNSCLDPQKEPILTDKLRGRLWPTNLAPLSKITKWKYFESDKEYFFTDFKD